VIHARCRPWNLLAEKNILPDKLAENQQKLTMIAKCQCQLCGGNVEFEVAEFEFSGETSHRRLGQTIDCPHCHKPTQLYMNKAEFVASKTPNWSIGSPLYMAVQPERAKSRMTTCADCGAQMSRRALWCPSCGSIQRSLFGLLFNIACTLALVWLVFGLLGWLILKLMETLGAASP
jgi:hypothetical protein